MARIAFGTVSSCVAPPGRARNAYGYPVGAFGLAASGTTYGAALASASTSFSSRGSGSSRRPAWQEEAPELSGCGGRIGNYLLLERVGQGRQADVWRASSPGSGGDVALKVLPPSNRDPRRRAQLRREAERGARLAGPSLLPTYEYGEDDGAAFMAMPLVVGCTLATVISQRRACRLGRRSSGMHRLATAPGTSYTREVVGIVARVALAAADAHAGRVAHRDIKPGNILIRPDHLDGVYLCDFGLARDLDVATPGQLRDGAGSPLYMPPERLLRGTADEVRADVFALGVTLFEALTLSPPIEVPPSMPSSQWAAFLARTPPRRASSLRPSTPPAIEAAIDRALARDPANRYPTAVEFAADLEHWIAIERETR